LRVPAREGRLPSVERSPRQLAEFLYLLARQELKARYKGRFLGYVWALAHTFALAFVYWIAFKIIMGLDVPNYSVYLIVGMFPWVWLAVGVTSATRSFVMNAPLIKEMGLAHAILPLSNVVQEMAHFVLALPAVITWVVIPGDYDAAVSWLWQIPLMLVLQLAFVYPIALGCALVNAHVRDVDYLLGIAFPLLFFATPMVYPIEIVPEPLHEYFELNPLHALMQAWRSVFMKSALDLASLAYVAGWALALAAVAWLLHRKLAPRVGEVV
jgi:homopolymeric O-antigen transport system permease protein